MLRPFIAALCLAGMLTSAIAADEKLKAAAEKAQPSVVETLRDMVMIESGSTDVAGLARIADLLETRLKAMGGATERRKVSTGPGADIVIARWQGKGTKKLMLIGHMDTVYQTGILATQPYKVEGDKIFGPGIADDKGGLAVILHSLKILVDSGWSNFAQLTVVMNPDEEIGSIGSGAFISEIADQHDYVLSCEPTFANPATGTDGILLGASGIATAFLTVKGRASHAGAAPQLGRNALVELSHQILQTRDIAKDIPGAQLNWTVSQAGTVRNQIAETATATGDVRLTSPDASDKLKAALEAKVKSALVADTETTVRIEPGRPPFLASEKSRVLADRAKAIYAELGRPLELVPMTGGGTDAAYAAKNGKATVLESFGLAGFGYHARDEYVLASSIAPRLYLMTRLLTDIAKD